MLYSGISLVELKVSLLATRLASTCVTSVTWSSCSVTETVNLVEACRDVEVSLVMFSTLL